MRLFTIGLTVLAWLTLLAASVSFLYYYDPTRIFFMGMKSKNSFAFDPLPEQMTNQDFSKQIRYESLSDFGIAASSLQNLLWSKSFDIKDFQFHSPYILMENGKANPDREDNCTGQFIEIAMPTICKLSLYEKWENLNRLVQYQLDFEIEYQAYAYVLEPEAPNGKAVIYHHGYAGTYNDNHVHIKKLIDAGYMVGALNIPTYGENMRFNGDVSRALGILNGRFGDMKRPLSLFFDPVHAMVNHMIDKQSVSDVYMMGISAGAWVTAVSAAVDTRISKSYPVAGVMPISLRQGDKERAAPQFYEPLLERATYLEMFALGAMGKDRRQLQIFNRYDRCCFNNVRGKLYEKTLQEALVSINDSGFNVLIDETHARHKISSWAMNKIMEDMAK